MNPILELIKNLRAVEARATQGPWEVRELYQQVAGEIDEVCSCEHSRQIYKSDYAKNFAFISTSRNCFLGLLDALETSVKALDTIRTNNANDNAAAAAERAERTLATIAKHLTP